MDFFIQSVFWIVRSCHETYFLTALNFSWKAALQLNVVISCKVSCDYCDTPITNLLKRKLIQI